MTPEERAEEIIREASKVGSQFADFCGALSEGITSAIREAVEEEREACAKVCDAKAIERRLVSEAMGSKPDAGHHTQRKDLGYMMDKAGRLGGESVARQLAHAIRSRVPLPVVPAPATSEDGKFRCVTCGITRDELAGRHYREDFGRREECPGPMEVNPASPPGEKERP